MLIFTFLLAAAQPHLGILVVFDQMRAADLDRLQPLWGDFGGIDKGARFDAFYDYAATETGPGHATLATCANPNVHGIIANHWFENGKDVYAAAESTAERLMVGTLGDAMRAATNGASKVVAVSLKDRAALLAGGKSANVQIWFDIKLKRFVALHEFPKWAEPLAVPKALSQGGEWQALPTPPLLTALIPKDENPNEGGVYGFSDHFPHNLQDVPASERAEAYRGTPAAMHDVFQLALAAIDGEHLGKGPLPDLLVVSISSTDYVQHWFGPTSAEAADMLRRADKELRAFRAEVAKKVGPVVLAVAADHAGTPVPENIAALGAPAGRIPTKALIGKIDEAMQKISPRSRVVGFYPPHLYLDFPAADRDKVIRAAHDVLLATPGIAAVYDPQKPPSDDPFEKFFRQVIFPGRSGTLLVRQAPRFLFGDEKTGSDHGSVYTYDRHIAFILDGPGVSKGRYSQPVDARDVAPSMAFLLNAPLPEACEGKPVPAVGR